MKKWRILLVIIILLFPSIFINTSKSVAKNDENPIADFIYDLRGIEVDFTPPDLITDCGSLFTLDVTIKNRRIYPRCFSVVVFMDLIENDPKHNIQRIGNEPFVYLSGGEEKTIHITCLTKNNTIRNLNCLNSGERDPIDFIDGRIGVKITKSLRWIIDGFTLRNTIYNELFFKRYSFNKLYSSFWYFVSTKVRPLDKSIQWYDSIKFVHPFVCSNAIKISDMSLTTEGNDSTVTKNEVITIEFEITNCLDHDIYLSTLVDMSTEKIFNDLFPVLPEDIYNLFYNETYIEATETEQICFQFSFPDESFNRQEYTITMECAPYIDIQNTNLFGVYSYDMRYKTLVTPFYLENETVKEAAEHFWYNLPIFNQTEDESSSIFLNHYFEIEYVGENPTEELVREVIEELDNNLFIFVKIFFIVFAPAALLWGVIQWVVRKKT